VVAIDIGKEQPSITKIEPLVSPVPTKKPEPVRVPEKTPA